MSQAIITRYHGPGNVRGSRIKATAWAGSITLNYEPSLSADENHAAAAKALADKFKWRGCWFSGGHPDGDGSMIYVSVNDHIAGLQEHMAFATEGQK